MGQASTSSGAVNTNNITVQAAVAGTLQAKAGPVAIAQNDIVTLGGYPAALFPAQVSDYAAVAAAGSAAVALTTYSTSGSNQNSTRNMAYVDPATGDIFIVDAYLATQNGCQIWKYSVSGALLANYILDSTALMNVVQMAVLSNGNLIVQWGNISTPYTQYFAILDKFLNVVVAKTAIASTATNPASNAHLIALSGGGFAFVYSKATVGVYLTIRNNAGAVVLAPTLIPGVTANSGDGNGPRMKMAQLSNGNIAIAICDTAQINMLQYCIYTAAGASVVGYTALVSGNSGNGNNGFPEISVMPGYFCITSSGTKAYVINNAGAVQGAPLTFPFANGYSVSLINDGTYFWLGYYTSAFGLARIPITGNAYVSTETNANALLRDMFFDRNVLMVCDGVNVYKFAINENGVPSLIGSSAFSMGYMAIGVGDFCALGIQQGKFNVIKLMNASMIGIAQTAVAAGNAGTLVTINQGPGGYITNEIKGTIAKAYDHSAATIIGNKGTLYLNSVTLKGI